MFGRDWGTGSVMFLPITPAITPALELLLLFDDDDTADRVPEVSAAACAADVSVDNVPRSQAEESTVMVLDPVAIDAAEVAETVCPAVTVAESLAFLVEVFTKVDFGVAVGLDVVASTVVLIVVTEVVVAAAAAVDVVSFGVVVAATAAALVVVVLVVSSWPPPFPSLPPPP